jgi:lipopolysaccharide export LptBFGC system permease protein LptF
MARITKEEYRASAASGLNLRDVVAAWLVCALVASIALAVSSDFSCAACLRIGRNCFDATHAKQRGNALNSEKMT